MSVEETLAQRAATQGPADIVIDPTAIARAHARAAELGIVLEVATKSSTPDSPALTRALARLSIMPGPDDATPEYGDQFIASPWQTVKTTIGDVTPARLETVTLTSLAGTLPNLTRDRISKYLSEEITTDRQYALVVAKDGVNVIVDGHHRLMAQWLLGQATAQVWIVQEN